MGLNVDKHRIVECDAVDHRFLEFDMVNVKITVCYRYLEIRRSRCN